MKVIRLVFFVVLLFPVLVSAGRRFPIPPPHSIDLIPAPEGLYRDDMPIVLESSHPKHLRAGYDYGQPYYVPAYDYHVSLDEGTDEIAERLKYDHALAQSRLRASYRDHVDQSIVRSYSPYYYYDQDYWY